MLADSEAGGRREGKYLVQIGWRVNSNNCFFSVENIAVVVEELQQNIAEVGWLVCDGQMLKQTGH